MSKLPTKKTARVRKKTPPKVVSKTSSTSAEPEVDPSAEALKAAMGLLAPALKFHTDVEAAGEDDVRIFWDVRVVRGKNTNLAQTQGVSTMPSALHETMRSKAPGMIQQEITDKISAPLTAVMMEAAYDEQSSPRLDRIAETPIDELATSGDAVLSLANEGVEMPSAQAQIDAANREARGE